MERLLKTIEANQFHIQPFNLNYTTLLRKHLLRWYLDNGVRFSLNKIEKKSINFREGSNLELIEKDLVYRVSKEKKHDLVNAVEATSLKSLRKEIELFNGCSLKRTATNLVFADGNPEAEVMLLGEAPGEEEDKLGKPFVGSAGKLLDKMLAAINQDRTNTYLSNIVFWRPPGNRNPTEEEIKSCLPFVIRHIEIIKPKILILAGAISAKTILNNNSEGITKLRGKWYHKSLGASNHKVKIMPIFHPAFLLRQPARKREAWEDLKEIRLEIENSA